MILGEWMSLLAVGFWLTASALLAVARFSLREMATVPMAQGNALPWVSVIIPARNEERHLEEALRSVVQLDYPHLEIIVINDRSTDRTGHIADQIARQAPRVRVRHVAELPDGWLGKNHALHQGAKEAKGKYLLFTDADVLFHPSTLRRAIRIMEDARLDHLTVIPEDTMPGWVLRVIAATFGMLMFLLFQPWRMRYPRSHKYLGVGAFNLVRARAYWAVGGHRAIALRPDDDMKLAKLFKKHGFRQDVMLGKGLVSVEWYSSVGELIDGLMKNAFAGLDYRLSLVIGGTLVTSMCCLWPWVGLFFATGWTQVWSGVAVALMIGSFGYVMAPYGVKPWHSLFMPIAILLLQYIQWRAALLAYWTQGITWRGTHYPLRALKANKV
ncbi:MAG: glycosyltransferase [Nitrospirae bacterium]|nr:MAG: glycosyltransferase [Nitrospirota bacterium]